MQVGEAIAPPAVHTKPNEKCPFCPPPEKKNYKTYPGSANDSKILAKIMETPSQLTSLQGGARPQTGKADSNGYPQEQSAPEPRKEDRSTWYTHQAHHLISGNQALKGSPMEDWILASAVNEKDTGYSVNSTGNGFWAPSVPKEFVGKWGPGKRVLSDDERQQHAEAVMAEAGAQIHIGPHNISDPDDPQGHKHVSYDRYIKAQLVKISRRIRAWSNKCAFCEEGDGKPQATHRVHDVLDRLSDHLERKLKANRSDWDIFLSKYAMEYHKPVCQHGKKPRKKL